MTPTTPYAPPVSRVSDPAEPPRTKPDAVRRAAACLWISAAIALVAVLGQLPRLSATNELVQAATTAVFSAVLLALVAAKVSAGRGWARWVYVVIYVLGSLMMLVSFVLMPHVYLSLPALDQATMALQLTLQTIALVLLFTPASRKWFA